MIRLGQQQVVSLESKLVTIRLNVGSKVAELIIQLWNSMRLGDRTQHQIMCELGIVLFDFHGV